jgi:hypothetical protein
MCVRERKREVEREREIREACEERERVQKEWRKFVHPAGVRVMRNERGRTLSWQTRNFNCTQTDTSA